jgi:hypothetical protein
MSASRKGERGKIAIGDHAIGLNYNTPGESFQTIFDQLFWYRHRTGANTKPPSGWLFASQGGPRAFNQ